jgi:hypothetical protein
MSCRGRKIAPGGDVVVSCNSSRSRQSSAGDVPELSSTSTQPVDLGLPAPPATANDAKESFFGESYSDLRALSIIEAHNRHTSLTGAHPESSDRKLSDEKETFVLFNNLDLTHLEVEPVKENVDSETLLFSAESSDTIEIKSIVVSEVSVDSTESDASSSVSEGGGPSSGRLVANLQDIEDLLDTMDMGIAPSSVNLVHRKSE